MKPILASLGRMRTVPDCCRATRRKPVRFQRTTLLAALLLTAACRHNDAPPSEPFQFPIAVAIQGKPNDYWDAILEGMSSRLDAPGIRLEKLLFRAGEREAIFRRLIEGDWRATAFCLPNDEQAKQLVEEMILAGVPVVLVGTDLPNTARLGYVGTYYYDVGRRAGAWYARRIPSGEVVVIAGHPVPRAVSEFWDGFRHGLLFNRRVRARLIPLSDSHNTPSVLQKLLPAPQIKGIFLMGAEVAQQGVGAARRTNVGVLSWRESSKDWYRARQIDLLVLERPKEIGIRAGNLLRNLSQGRGADRQIVYVPYEWLAR
ncbi:MAG: substrate-binding domain-containing protein [Fimbriimonadales bacterium]